MAGRRNQSRPIRVSRLCAMAAALLALVSRAATARAETYDCGVILLDGGAVAGIVDARTIRLDDGREIVLSGIAVPDEAADRAAAHLRARLPGQTVILIGGSDMPDRYGRQHAYVVAEEALVQIEMLRQGLALRAGDTSGTCHEALAQAETPARDARRGIWASSALKNAESSGEILARIGQFTVITGRISSVRTAGATTYLNFGPRWTRDFAATISNRSLAGFTSAGFDIPGLKGRRVWLRGWIEQRGGPRLHLTDPGQIEIAPRGARPQR